MVNSAFTILLFIIKVYLELEMMCGMIYKISKLIKLEVAGHFNKNNIYYLKHLYIDMFG